MTQRFKTAYEIIRERMQALDRRLSRQAPPRAAPVKEAVAKRLAAAVPFTPPAISILAPKPDDALTIRRFVRDEFREAQAKKKAIVR